MRFALPVTIPWIIPLMILIAGWYVVFWLLARRLRRAFPSTWDLLGRPLGHPFIDSLRAWGPNFRLMLFVWRRQHVDLGDHKITLLVWCARIGLGLVNALGLTSCLDTSPPRTIHFGSVPVHITPRTVSIRFANDAGREFE
jgi:hypothetical protein